MPDLIQQQRADLSPYFVSLDYYQPNVRARYRTGAGHSIPNNADTLVNFDTATYDPLGLVTPGASWKFVAPYDAGYAVAAQILYAASTAWADTEAGYLSIYKNGARYSYLHRKDSYGSASSVLMSISGVDTIELVTGDELSIYAFQNTGGSLALFSGAGADQLNYVNIWRI